MSFSSIHLLLNSPHSPSPIPPTHSLTFLPLPFPLHHGSSAPNLYPALSSLPHHYSLESHPHQILKSPQSLLTHKYINPSRTQTNPKNKKKRLKMGMCASSMSSRGDSYSEKEIQKFIHKMRLLQQEITLILKQREEESEAYERQLLLMAVKEAEWKRQRKKLKDEVKRLKSKLRDREDKVRAMEDEMKKNKKMIMMSREQGEVIIVEDGNDKEQCTIGRLLMMDQELREERARRDEAVEKWKMLYLSIKEELDHLIHKTQQGTLYWRAEEEELIEELQNELKAKDEIIQVLKAQIGSMEDKEYKKKRELDILRQSLRIISSNKESTSPTSVVKSRSLHLTKNIIKLAFL